MPPGPLTLKEKAEFLGLLVFAILVVVLGFKNFSNNIKAPFAAQLATAPAPGEPTEEEINQQLKNKDTDHDGLNDYDELHFYQTSPYVADTDSDGVADGAEIQKGTDPNCPEGKTCSFGGQAQPAPSQLGVTAPAVPPSLEGLLNTLTAGSSDAKAWRQFLVSQGVDQKLLQKISDQELLSILREEAKATSTISLPSPTGKGVEVRGFNAQEWRQELLKQGIDPKVLEKLSDEELQKMISETLKGS